MNTGRSRNYLKEALELSLIHIYIAVLEFDE